MKFYMETERIILREILETDVTAMFELDSNPEVHKYLGNNPARTIVESEKNIAFIRSQYITNGIGRFAVIEKETNLFMGWSGLKLNRGEKEKLNGFTNFIDIGYRLIPMFWGKGYALESALATLAFGFKEMKYPVIYGAADTQNSASNKILKKIGLQFVNEFEYEKVKVNWYQLKKESDGK